MRITDPDRVTLLELARKVAADEPWADRAAKSCVPLIATDCPNALSIFDELVEAMRVGSPVEPLLNSLTGQAA